MAEKQQVRKTRATRTTSFGVGKRESHDASDFYARFTPPALSDDEAQPIEVVLDEQCILGDARDMTALPDNCVGLVVTSPPYFVGKEYELAVVSAADDDDPDHGVPTSYFEYLEMLGEVFAECVRVLEPGGRIAVNVANLGRKPYRSLSSDIIHILQDQLGLLLRGEVLWHKADGATGSLAWGSYRSASNPVLRDLTERVIIASKGRFDRAPSIKRRAELGMPHENSLSPDEFMEATLDVWRIDPESAKRVNHPAPFPIELPQKLIDLYTFRNDIVLDPFLGSGTTIVAAQRTGRRGVGYDTDPEYVDIARQRLATERDRLSYQAVSVDDDGPLPLELPPKEGKAEHFQARATEEGKKAHDLAKMTLEEAGFQIIDEKPKVAKLGIQFNFLVTSEGEGRQWYVDVSGAFTTVRPGLMRTDTLWKMLGRIHVLQSAYPGEPVPVLILTSNLPRRNSEGDKALRAVGPSSVFDAVEMFDPTGAARLAHYASTGTDLPVAGFWTDDDLDGMS